MFNVIIIGAGPTGLSVASELARQGITNILVIDKNHSPVLQTKATGLFTRSFQILSKFPGVGQDLEKRMKRITKSLSRLTPVSAKSDHGLLGTIDLTTPPCDGFLFGEQWYTEKCISAYLAKQGVVIRRGVSVENIFQNGETCFVDLVALNSKSTLEARYVVACDGARSTARKLLGIDYKGEQLPGSYFACHFKAKDPIDCDEYALEIRNRSNGSGFVSALPDATNYCAFDLDPEQSKQYCTDQIDSHGDFVLRQLTLKEAEAFLKERLDPTIRLQQVIWSSHFRVNQRVATEYGRGSIFLAGDACHGHTPLGGQGMNTGIGDAVNIAWKLAFVLNGKFSPLLLSSYEPERQRVGNFVVTATSHAQKSSSSRNSILQIIRNAGMQLFLSFPSTRSVLVSALGQISHSYSETPHCVEHWVKPEIFPNLLLRRRQNILRLFSDRVKAGDLCRWDVVKPMSTTGFKLLLFTGLDGHLKQKSALDLQEFGDKSISRTKGIITEYCIVQDAAAHKVFGVYGQAMFLVRPDDFVGFRCEPVLWSKLNGYLVNLLGAKYDTCVDEFEVSVVDWVPYVILSVVAVGVWKLASFLKRG